MNVKIVERYKINTGINRFDLYKTYNDISDVIDTVYVLNIDGKDLYTTYATKEEAEQAALKYNRDKYLQELKCQAESKLQEMTKFRFRLSHLNHIYSTWKHEKKYTINGGKEFFDTFREENPVINMLPKNEQHKCYITLMKARLKKRISEYYKIKKDYITIKEKIKKIKSNPEI